jgi:hypothetical protein
MKAKRPQRDITEGERMLRSRGANRARLIAEERRHSPGWFYLSFATDYEFLGAAVVRAQGFLTAVQRASGLGINPGGDVVCQGPIPRKDLHRVPDDLRNRLLTEAEVRKHLEGTGVGE